MKKHADEEGHQELLWIIAPAVLLSAIALFITYQFVDPAPPKRITIATGSPDGAYYAYAQRYRKILARDGITLDIRKTDGSLENIELLEAPDSGVDVAFVQGGTGGHAEGDTLRSLASLYYEPLWMFVRRDVTFARASDVVGKRVSIGPERSGTRALTLELLRDAGFTAADLVVSELNDTAAADALLDGRLDMMTLVASPTSPLVERLVRADEVVLIGFARAEAMTRRHRFLSKLTLPEGAIDLSENLPRSNIGLLAATANLVANENIHPALVDLLLLAAEEVHSDGGLFEQPGAFPSPRSLVFPLNEDAKRFFTSGPPFLRRTLPFWAATLIDRLAVMLLPLVAVIIPLMRIMPPLYKWRVRRRVYRWYKELRKIERDIQQGIGDGEQDTVHEELDRIDEEVRKVKIPWAYAEELYQLRLHIRYVREGLNNQEGTAGATRGDPESVQPRGAHLDALEDGT